MLRHSEKWGGMRPRSSSDQRDDSRRSQAAHHIPSTKQEKPYRTLRLHTHSPCNDFSIDGWVAMTNEIEIHDRKGEDHDDCHAKRSNSAYQEPRQEPTEAHA